MFHARQILDFTLISVVSSLGHFSIRSIQLSFSLFVYPSICLAYPGQGARLVRDGAEVLPNLFYTTIPGTTTGPLYWYVNSPSVSTA